MATRKMEREEDEDGDAIAPEREKNEEKKKKNRQLSSGHLKRTKTCKWPSVIPIPNFGAKIAFRALPNC